MSYRPSRTTKVLGTRQPNPVAALIEQTASAEGSTVSDFLFSCVAENLDAAQLAAAQHQAELAAE